MQSAKVATAVWAVDCDNRMRHCWPLKDGTRIIDGSNDLCTRDHSDDPKIVGKVEWLRFIHEWKKVSRFFIDDDASDLKLNSDGADTSDGRHCYCEEYSKVDGPVVFRIFLNNLERWARIECYDPALFEDCDRVWKIVQESYSE